MFWPIAKKWIAGREISDAIQVAEQANARKIDSIINRLGEHTPDPQLIQEYTEEYIKLLEAMRQAGDASLGSTWKAPHTQNRPSKCTRN